MRFANVRMLKTHTAELLHAVEGGEEVVITYHGKPKAVLVKLVEEPDQKTAKRKPGVLQKNHPFLKLMGTATDEASDVSSNKYRYVALATEGKG